VHRQARTRWLGVIARRPAGKVFRAALLTLAFFRGQRRVKPSARATPAVGVLASVGSIAFADDDEVERG
jgi:hypothetical protein